jgi:GAF domain-containing protein
MALATLTLGVFIASVPAYLNQQIYALPEAERAALAQIGLSTRSYAGYTVGLDIITMLAFALAAAAIFQRRSDDRMAVFVSTALLMFGTAVAPTLDALVAIQPAWQLPVLLVRVLGIGLFLLVFYLFPDGQFVPHWIRPLALVWVGWLLSWSLFPTASLDPDSLPLPLRFLAFLVSSGGGALVAMLQYVRVFSFFLVLLGWFGSGVFAQIYRYVRVSSPVQRQQTKWVVFGTTVAFVGYFGSQLPLLLAPSLRQPGLAQLRYRLIVQPVSLLFLLLVPLSMALSMLRRRLWDIDPIIQRTLVYGTLTGTLAAVYLGSVLLFQRLFRALTGQQADVAVVLSTLASAALFQPLRRRLQGFIDRRFYRERVDFRKAFTHFSREVRTIIDLPELLRMLVNRTTDLLHITHGTVFLRGPGGTFQLAETRDLPADEVAPLSLETQLLGPLRSGRTVSRPNDKTFPLLVPLIAPRTDGSELVGVLALGPRLSGQGYSREDQALLMGLAGQAGTAIYVARLIQEKQEEARRREEVERRLEAYRNSPVGRAEAFAQTLLERPAAAFVELHRLAQAAGHDPDSASLIDNLPGVLDSLGAGSVAKLAEGLGYLVTSQFEPEVLPVGLRTLTGQLSDRGAEGWQYAAETLGTYRLCQAALDASSIAQVTQLLPSLQGGEEGERQAEGRAQQPAPLRDLARSLNGLHAVAEALHAYERVDTSRDKLAYLASAVEQLRRVYNLARAELGSADRPVIGRIAESWLAVVTGAMSELQTRAQIVCRLLTRHTWHSDVVPLVLNLRNEGRGAALNLQVALVPKPEYTVLDAGAYVERIAPGEEARVELRVRPHLEEGADHFRARFTIRYTDPRGPDQVEHFADLVRLLTGEGEFQFIPNPYVVGTPLDAGSPLFFGREDVLAFIQENLLAHYRNNLVLIGQRRTGKTSLLKQLPVRLGDDYLPVYLDGQALGLDPGLPNFFLALATEIAFALEDRGFGVDLPEYDDFADSPAASFEREFLGRVRDAIGHRHLLIMFDEFEELETAARRGALDPSIFGFLRHLVQHADNLSVIFCGTHRLEELTADYWNVLFNISLYRHIGFLEQPEAVRLIQEPVAEYGMRYDDLALDKMWQVTAGHPYFLQLLCHSLVNRHNRTERSYLTVVDVNAALEEILASGEAHFMYLWTEAGPEERLVLAALSRMTPLTGHATPVQVVDYLAGRGVHLERRVVSEALHRLTLRDILLSGSDGDPASGEVYRWRLGLLGLWVEKYRSLSRIVDQVRGK